MVSNLGGNDFDGFSRVRMHLETLARNQAFGGCALMSEVSTISSPVCVVGGRDIYNIEIGASRTDGSCNVVH